MKFQSKAEKKELDMTAMIDITFLLIAFFMILINFSEADQNERIKLPVSELAKPPEMPPVEPIVLQILESGLTIYNNVDYDLPGLTAQLDFHKRFLAMMDIPIKEATVIIRADAHSAAGRVQDVIELCQELGLENFKLRAKQSE